MATMFHAAPEMNNKPDWWTNNSGAQTDAIHNDDDASAAQPPVKMKRFVAPLLELDSHTESDVDEEDDAGAAWCGAEMMLQKPKTAMLFGAPVGEQEVKEESSTPSLLQRRGAPSLLALDKVEQGMSCMALVRAPTKAALAERRAAGTLGFSQAPVEQPESATNKRTREEDEDSEC